MHGTRHTRGDGARPHRVVVSLDAGALSGAGPAARVTRSRMRVVARALAPLAAVHELVICYAIHPVPAAGDATSDGGRPVPLDALDVQAQTLIGYWLVQELHNAGVARPTAALVTEVLVKFTDPDPDRPTQFVGPRYSRDVAQRLADSCGWRLAEDGPGWRRVVARLTPLRTAELATIRATLARGIVTICGCAVAVVEDESGKRVGVDAVVDPGRVAARLARDLGADLLLLLTDSAEGDVEVAAEFVEATGRRAAVGAISDAMDVLLGHAGTTINDHLENVT